MGTLKLGIALFCLLSVQIEATETGGTNRTCPSDSLPCNDGECVIRGKWCDGEKNCQDESDEGYCLKNGWWNKNPNKCEDSHFKCETGPCIPLVGRCDGFEDCKDKSDEWYCEPETFDDYDDYMLSNSSSVVQTESTTKESSTESDELENDDITTATHTSHLVSTKGVPLTSSTTSFYAKRIEQESIQTDIPHSTKPSTTTPNALPVTDPITSQVIIKSTTSSKPVPSAPHLTKAYQSRRSSSNPILTSTRPSIDPRRQPTVPLSTPFSIQQKRPSQTGYPSGPTTSIYSPTRSYAAVHLPITTNTPTSKSPDRRNNYQLSTQPASYLESRRSPPSYSQTRHTMPHDTRRESYHYPTQSPISSSSRQINQNQHISSFRITRTDGYHHQTQPIRPQEASRTISESQRQNRPNSFSTLQQPYNARQSRQQPFDNRQQTYDTRQQPYDDRQQPYDSRRNHDQFSGSDSYLDLPTGQVGPSQYPHHVTIGTTINGFQIYRIFSSDGSRHFYEGYYNQNGQFVTLSTNQRQERYTQHSTAPPRRTWQQPSSTAPPRRTWQQPSSTAPPRRSQPLTISTAAPVFDGKLKAPSRFYFAKNYTRNYLHKNAEYIEKGRDWILSTRDSEGGWGKETPRALIALSLINNSFVNDTYDNNILQKYFQVYLSTSLIRGDIQTASVNRLAMSVNALIATCQNPRDFHGTDYTELIRSRLRDPFWGNQDRRNDVQSVNPFVYLSLCLADRNLDQNEEYDLMTRLQRHYSLDDEFEQDKQTMAISAFTCHLQRIKAIYYYSSEYHQYYDSLLSNATSKLLKRLRDDGSFGSVYSTAIAAQALMSVNDTKDWNPELTFNFLREHQEDDGSFGDFLATYLVLPALSGRSLLHLRNTQCTPPNSDRALTPTEILEYRGPKYYVKYSLYIGYPKTNGYSIEVHAPVGINFFDIMRVAAHKNDAFQFSYEERDGVIHVYSISNVPNDSERGLEWNLFETSRSNLQLDNPESLEPIRRDIKKFFPRSDRHVIFWYKPSAKWA